MIALKNSFIVVSRIHFIGVEERIPEFQEPMDLRSNAFQGGGNDAIPPLEGIE